MSDTTPEPQAGQSQGLGFTTRTDAIVGPGSQADTSDNERASVPPVDVVTGEPVNPTAQTDGGGIAGHPAGEPLGKDAPPLASLEGHQCPNCTAGVLEVTRYDPYALHEQNQGAALEKGHESGGGYEVRCRYCDYTDSRALNPGKLWGR